MNKKNQIQNIRLVIQLLFVIFVLYLSVGHYLEENNTFSLPGIASLHAICPFGGVATLYTFITSGDYVQKLHQSDFIMLIALIVLLIFAGSSFCGWICPLGSIQEWIGKLGRVVLKEKYNKIPEKIDKYLRYLKYFILIWVLIETTRTTKLVFQDYDPYYNLFNIWTDEIAISGYIVVILTLGLSFVIERPFCRYACPLGAINGIFNSISIFTIKRKKDSCLSCGVCDQVCPAGIVVSSKSAVKSTDCIRCLKCVETCPENNKDLATLKIRPFITNPATSKITLKNGMYIFIIFLLFFGSIFFSIINGYFISERIKTYETTSDIRGSSTIEEIINNYKVTRNILEKAYNIPESISSDTKLKDLAGIMELEEELEVVSPESIRNLVNLLDKDINIFAEQYNLSLEEINKSTEITDIKGMTLRDVILSAKEGSIAFLQSGYWPDVSLGELSSTNLASVDLLDQIKGNTSLFEIKKNIGSLDLFFQKFSIPNDIELSTTLKSIKDKYGIEIYDIRTFIEENYIE